MMTGNERDGYNGYIWLLNWIEQKGREKDTNKIKTESMEKHACNQTQFKYYAAAVTLCKQQILELFSEWIFTFLAISM